MCKLPTISMFFRLSGIVAMCAIVVTPLDTVAADEPPLPAWAPTDTRREPDASLFPSRQDIFQGATDRPAIGLPSSMGGQMPSAGNFFDSGKSNAAANIGSAARNAQAGDQLGAFQAVGAGGSRSPSGLGAVGQVVGGAGGAVRQVANTVQAGAQVVGAVGILGNGIGAGPFGQFGGQNNQVLQGLQFVALLQQLFATFFPSDSALQFNQANTGQSARTSFANLMGANGNSVAPTSFNPPTGACDNSSGYREQYQRVYDSLEGSSFIGTVPEDGAQYGITTGSREEWANFFTRLARVESGYNPNTAVDINGRREGTLTSFGVYQMGQSQFNTFGGGNIYNATDNTNAFVRYAESMYFGTGSYGAGGGTNRLAGRSGDQWLGLAAGYGPLRRTSTGSQNSNESFLLASNAC